MFAGSAPPTLANMELPVTNSCPSSTQITQTADAMVAQKSKKRYKSESAEISAKRRRTNQIKLLN